MVKSLVSGTTDWHAFIFLTKMVKTDVNLSFLDVASMMTS